MKMVLGVLAMLAAAVLASAAPAKADPFTGKDQTCIIGERAGDIAASQGALVLVTDADGRVTSLRIKHGYYEMLDPVAAVAGGMDSFRELLGQISPLGGDSQQASVPASGMWGFIYNSHNVIPPPNRSHVSKGYMDCVPNLPGSTPNLKGAMAVFDTAANQAVVK